jgi:hypothetical protein
MAEAETNRKPMRITKIPAYLPDAEPQALPEHCAKAREQINALGRIYLDAGLPLAAAFQAALADYEHQVGELSPCFA